MLAAPVLKEIGRDFLGVFLLDSKCGSCSLRIVIIFGVWGSVCQEANGGYDSKIKVKGSWILQKIMHS